jgi:hypothetical protein
MEEHGGLTSGSKRGANSDGRRSSRTVSVCVSYFGKMHTAITPGSLYPACRAANMDPIESFWHE